MPTDEKARRVRVWFGPHMICAHEAKPEKARAYAHAMPDKFYGLRVTIDDLSTDDDLPVLPGEAQWPLTIK